MLKETANRHLMDKKELARYLRCSLATVARLIAERAIPFSRIRNRVRFEQDDVIRYVKQHRVHTKKEILEKAGLENV